MESFPSITEAAIGSWLRICLIESKDRIILSKDQAFRGVGKVTLI